MRALFFARHGLWAWYARVSTGRVGDAFEVRTRCWSNKMPPMLLRWTWPRGNSCLIGWPVKLGLRCMCGKTLDPKP
jgi:hypothetical protein